MNNTDKFLLSSGIGGLGSGLAGFLFGGGNPADAAMGPLNQIPGQVSKYYDPYIEAGKGVLPRLQGEYGNLLNDPGGMLNKIGEGYQQSPGFKFALQQALQGAGHAAAAGGMAGSPMHEQQNMQIGTNLANQDYYNWLTGATNLYGKGLEGEQGLAGLGFQAGSSMADQIAQMLAAKAKLQYEAEAQKNQREGSLFGDIGQGVGALAAFFGG